ncbi:MAG: MFS transporter [Flavobacteriales bacterium]
MWGFITVMNDVLNNAVDDIYHLDEMQRSRIQMVFFGAFFIVSLIYFLISSLTGKDPINRIGYNRGMIGSLVLCGIGCFLFYPAAKSGSYEMLLLALSVLATGVTCLQICANPYAAIMGRPESASSRLNLAQGLNSLGTTLAPVFGLLLIYRMFSDGKPTVDAVASSYFLFGSAFILLALIIVFFKLPAYRNEEKIESGFTVLMNPQLALGIIAIFFYVGSEVTIGNWLVDYLKSINTALDDEQAGYFLSFYWGGLMIGRVMASFAFDTAMRDAKKYLLMTIASLTLFGVIYLFTGVREQGGAIHFHFFSPHLIWPFVGAMLLQFVAFRIGKSRPSLSIIVFFSLIFLLLIITMCSTGNLAFWSIICTGLFFSIGWSNIFTLAIAGLGKYTSQGSALLVMAIAGGAVLPRMQALLIKNEVWGIKASFIVPALGVLYIIFYGWWCSRRKAV